MNNIPNRVYLQVGEIMGVRENIDFNELKGVTWCRNKVYKGDISYQRVQKRKVKSIDSKLKKLLLKVWLGGIRCTLSSESYDQWFNSKIGKKIINQILNVSNSSRPNKKRNKNERKSKTKSLKHDNTQYLGFI